MFHIWVFIFYSSKTAAAHSKHEVTDNGYLPELPKLNTCLQCTEVRGNPSRMLVMNADVELFGDTGNQASYF